MLVEWPLFLSILLYRDSHKLSERPGLGSEPQEVSSEVELSCYSPIPFGMACCFFLFPFTLRSHISVCGLKWTPLVYFNLQPRKKDSAVWDHATYKQAVRKAMFARFKELDWPLSAGCLPPSRSWTDWLTDHWGQESVWMSRPETQ